jgi:glyoxylase-like metal-dependent hydrolase (beta-lactamase superfamily II)
MAPASSLPRDAIRVRMYRVGFGDCFLVSFPVGDGARHLLFDCGVHPNGDIGTLSAVLDNVESETDRRLAAVVATHEHADHLSGYGAFASRFARFQIDEIWMPWAMDPEDPAAVELRQRRMALAAALGAHFDAAGSSGGAAPAVRAILANLKGNDRALQALRSRFDGAAQRIRYLKADQKLRAGTRQPDPVGIGGLVVKVLGPPTDPEFLQRMEPPTSQRYMRPGARKETSVNAVRPFPRALAIDPREGRSLYRLTRQEEARIAEAFAGLPDVLAFALDSVVNNTSLVLLLSFRGRALLFPGDAQWGNWKYWIESPEAPALLEQVAFLKVAHHGSYNATPRRALEQMRKGGFAAFVSTQTSPWPSIPREPLMAQLAKRSRDRVLRSDSLRVAGAPEGPTVSLPAGFAQGDVWYDCIVPL